MSRQDANVECALYVVATPIGHLGDITQRALETLKNVDVIAAEDTRVSRGLLAHFGISTRLIAVHEHNEKNAAAGIVNLLRQGQAVALVTDAGTPAVSDPGALVVAAVREAGFKVIPIPGPSAVVAAISASGAGEHGFLFYGFLPATRSERGRALEKLKAVSSTIAQAIVFYESPHRVVEAVAALRDTFGDVREIVICRELTKKFETIHRAGLADAVIWLEADDNNRRGEFVLVLPAVAAESSEADAVQAQALQRTLEILCGELPLKQAVALAVELTGEKKNKVYEMALAVKAVTETRDE
jgi:16S rRNA (cytidine1402-2'-O)-methyltransferase